MSDAEVLEQGGARGEEQGLLFEYTIRLLLLSAFLELVLYRLVSRLGMHLSKVAQEHEWVGVAFKGLSSIGFILLNFVSLLVFLALALLLLQRSRTASGRLDAWLVPVTTFLLALTVAFLFFPPTMVGSVVYNVATFLVVTLLAAEYWRAHPIGSQRTMLACFILGVTGWLYYQTISTTYGLLGLPMAPPFAHEMNRIGEAFMVLASMLVFWAYAGVSFRTRNRRQRRRLAVFTAVTATLFLALLFMDYLLTLYDPAVAETTRKASQGIGWIFQMGMGYTFYLPFAFYVAGLLCWSYTVIKLVAVGRPAGYGLGLMFMAGYALQLSHLTLMVVLGLLLLSLDRRRAISTAREPVVTRTVPSAATPVFHGQT